MDELAVAFRWATKYHNGQTYGSEPYIYHINEVWRLCVEANLPIEYQIVAILHDIIEDTDFPLETIKRIFGHEIWDAVFHITHFENEDYFDSYLPRVKENHISKTVKLFDLLSNLEHAILDKERYGRLIKKYRRGLFELLVEPNKRKEEHEKRL